MFRIVITDLDKNETMIDIETNSFCNIALQPVDDDNDGTLISSAARNVSSFDLFQMVLGLQGAKDNYLERHPEIALMLMLEDDLINSKTEIDLTGVKQLKDFLDKRKEEYKDEA